MILATTTRTISSLSVRRIAAARTSRRCLSCLSGSNSSFMKTNSTISSTQRQQQQSPCRRWMSTDEDLPYHLVVGMPALSPTMDQGTLTAWHVKEGDTFGAGDSLADIETDKATIAFEAQDDGCVAKLLVDEGTADINVGTPIMITVEEEEDVQAFANYEVPAAAAAPAAVVEEEPVAVPEPVKKEEAPVVAAAAPAPAPVEPTTPAVPPPTPVVAEPAVAAASSMLMTPTMAPAWGSTAKVTSPIAKTLAAKQQKYIETYGTTGQLTL
mmetsp:Transcript_67/g.138  ORF Transcript_67/g.138 Transcript_67/m.138 type:complete len:269 (-) Transcript_67:196-1002(-)